MAGMKIELMRHPALARRLTERARMIK